MNSWSTTILFALLPSLLFSQDDKYLPLLDTSLQVVKHQHYVLGYSEDYEQAAWVAYELTSEESLTTTIDRKDAFRPDPLVLTGSASLADYSKSGFDRGHLAPAADFRFDDTAMSESFYMSNMSPQRPEFNRGGWKKLEALFRDYAIVKNGIHIVTGPVLIDTLKSIGNNQVSIPNYYYKVAITDSLESIAYLMPNARITSDLEQYIVSIDSIEALTRIDFFHELPDDKEDSIELLKYNGNWSVSHSEMDVLRSKQSSDIHSNTVRSQQCQGIAKSTGNRCRNKTKNPEGYCHLHD